MIARFVVLLAGVGATPVVAQVPRAPESVNHTQHLLLNRARVNGYRYVVLLVAARTGHNAAVASALERLGARVEAHYDDVDYLRVRLPLDSVVRAESTPGVVETVVDAGGQGYTYNDVDHPPLPTGIFDSLNPHPAPEPSRPSVPDTALRAVSPYTSAASMGVAAWIARHPTFDGRGVTIASLECCIEFAHPALRSARAANGAIVPKLAGLIDVAWYDAPGDTAQTLPARSGGRRFRVAEDATVDTPSGTVTRGDTVYHLPSPGRYHLGHWIFEGSRYAVAWRTAPDGAGTSDPAPRVWVDVNRDHDFRHERPMEDINRAASIGAFPSDSALGGAAAGLSFVTAFDTTGDVPSLYIGDYHATMTASVAAGHGLLGGVANGVAPAARVLLVASASRSTHSLIEGIIRAARHPATDVISGSVVYDPFPGDGESLLSLVSSRVVAKYHKPIFIGTGNSRPALAPSQDIANGAGVVAVGAYASAEQYRAQYGWTLPHRDWVSPVTSSNGPSENGLLKPDLIAPHVGIAASVCDDRLNAAFQPLTYRLPPCYVISGGTSAAAPSAAGAAALLVSAAKQSGVRYDARRIAWALTAGARYLSEQSANAQGAGLIQIDRAWDLLREAPDLPIIETRAPVRTQLARYLRTPGIGPGLYEREGWVAGQVGTRSITLTRISGPSHPVRYGITWLGNDGTFSAPLIVALALDQAVRVPVHIAPHAPGAHSAILSLLDPVSHLPVHRVMTTVVAAHEFSSDSGYVVRDSAAVPWPDARAVFVRVPPGVAALRIRLRVLQGEALLEVKPPDGLGLGPYTPGVSSIPIQHGGGEVATRLIRSPHPGVWELDLEQIANFDGRGLDGKLEPAPQHVPARFTLTAALEAATASIVPAARSAPRPAKSPTILLRWENRFAALGQAVTHGELGSMRQVDSVLDRSRPGPLYDIEVDSGSTTLHVSLRPSRDTTAQLDFYLYDCTTGHCYLWNDDHRRGAAKSLTVGHPRAGHWRVLVDPVSGRGGSVPYTYTEVMTHPKYGSVEIRSAPGPRAVGARWDELLEPHPSALPQGKGRRLVAVAELVDAQAEAEQRDHAADRVIPVTTPIPPSPIGKVIVP